MDGIDRFFQDFRRGVPDLFELAAESYSYAEPLYPGPFDRAGHMALMKQVLSTVPDRSMEVERRIPGADGGIVEATWSGMPPGRSEPLVLKTFFAFEVETGTGKTSRLRCYYDLPTS